jgi:hypothetical protein
MDRTVTFKQEETDSQSQCDFDFVSSKRIGTSSTEEYRRSACDDLKCVLKILFMCNI